MTAHGTFTPAQWDEKTTIPISTEQKITNASVVLHFSGDITGVARVEWLMFYTYADPNDPHRSNAAFVGLMRFEGTLNGKAGSFVMEDHGTFQNGALHSVLTVLEDSGTGELASITGRATYASRGMEVAFEIEYELK